MLADGIVLDHKSAESPCEREILPSIHVHASVSIIRVFSISKGGIDHEDEVRLHAQPLWNGKYIISSIWAILTQHINLGKTA